MNKKKIYLSLLLTFILLFSTGCSILNEVKKEPTSTPFTTIQATISPTPDPNEGRDKVQCIRVVDGDTIYVRNEDGEEIGVRLLGVDTPETKHPTKPVEYYGPEASTHTERRLSGRTLWLDYEKNRIDKYGRTLAYVFFENGTLFNLELVRYGFAKLYDDAKGLKYQSVFKEALELAKNEKLGLWAEPMPTATIIPQSTSQATETPTKTPKPQVKTTAKPTSKSTPKPTAKPTTKITNSPAPTPKPTVAPTNPPTAQPTTIPTPVITVAPTEKVSYVVVAPASGKKYHKTNSCSGLRNANSTKSITLQEAQNSGYTPCRICYK